MAYQFNQGDRPLPGYTIQRGVGRGGFGEVYYATSDGGKEIALKYLRENPQIELRGVSHCLNLKSPYLVALHDIRQNADGDHFVIMEYVSGPSMRDLMNGEPSGLGAQKAAYFLRELGKGLAYLHDRGIVHRDLKPGNIFYEDGYVKIGDYGLAKMMAASQHSGQTVSVGTVHYMAPEVGSGNYDRTIDIYALGVILYEMLLGRVPFSGSTMGEVLMKHLTAQPEVDELPEPFPGVIRKALAKDPKDRYQTVNEMIGAVFAVEDMDKSVAAFEPASLSTMAAQAAERANPAQAAIPVAQGGIATVLGTGSSNVGQNVPPPVIDPSPAAGRFGRFHARISTGVDRIADRIDESQIGQQVAEAARRPGHWMERILIGLLVAAGMSFGTSLLVADGSPLYATAFFFHILAIVMGVIFGCWLGLDRLKSPGKWLPRFIITVCGGVGLVPAALFAEETLGWPYGTWMTPLLLSMLLCDWPGRVREGRQGYVRLGSAFSVGLFCFVAGLIFGDGHGFTPAAIAAAASLTVQAVAGLWPWAPGATGRVARPRHDGQMGDAAGKSPRPWPGGSPRAKAHAPAVADHRYQASPGAAVEPADASPPLAQAVIQRPRRSGAVRAIWLFIAAILMLTMIMLFIASGLPGLSKDDFGGYIVGGIVAANYLLFALWCAAPRYKKGLWRGVFRQAVFFSGTALSGAGGASLGLFDWIKDDYLAMLACVIAGGIMSLFVWFVPVPAYEPAKTTKPDKDNLTPRMRKGRLLMKIGGILLGASMLLLVILLASLPERDYDDVIPPAVVPASMAALMLLGIGFFFNRPEKVKTEKLNLPLRNIFEIDAHPNLAQIIERHLAMIGFSLASKSDLLWSFRRGNWACQFWQEDVRRWGMKLNIAAYELDNGGYRLTCYLDMDRAFNRPDSKMMEVLQDELRELKDLLDGRDVSQQTGEPGRRPRPRFGEGLT